MNTHRRRICLALLFLVATSARAGLPASGKADPKYARFDELMQSYAEHNQVTAATIAIRVNNQLVFERGYGWRDEARHEPIKPDACFRIASLTKPITAAAIDVLIREKKFTLNSKAFELLDIKPIAASKVDPRLADITIEHLLHHQGGWDREVSGDLSWETKPIQELLHLTRAPTPEEIVSYAMSRPLDFAPGTRRAYSNVGYMALGLLIKKYSGTDYYSFVQKSVLAPIQIVDAVPVRSLLKDCDPREVWYSDDTRVDPVVDSAGPGQVSMPYGGFVAENRYAVGGWVMSAATYARFMDTYALYGDHYTKGSSWRHGGSQPGIWATALWRKDGTKIVAFFNRQTDDPSITQHLDELANELWPAIDKSSHSNR